MKTLIRHSTSKDFPRLLSIDQACFSPDVAYDYMDLKHMMSRPGAETLVLEEGGEIRGFLLMDIDLRRKSATLVTLDVLSEDRRRGYASSLFSRSEEILKSYGVQHYHLQVDVNNDAAIAFYRKNGFKEERLLRKYYPGSRDAWQMVKKLP
jgi:ribosomal protein S18 acetylase RimI-like enzyme